MVKIPQIIIPKSEIGKFKNKCEKITGETTGKSLLVGIPVIPSDVIPEGHYIINNGNEMVIFYPDGKTVTINDLTELNDFPEIINKLKK